ncbi:MAG: hypothetical protein AAFV33_13150 [Chloroflexota bacterium]
MKTKAQAETEARKIVSDWVKGAVLTGWIPGSALVLTGADYVMMEQVARTFEVGAFDKDHAMQSIGTLAASGAAGGVIGEAIGLVPVIGWAVKSGMMGAKAHLIGNAVIDYFKERSTLPDTLPNTGSTASEATPPAPPAGKVRIQVEDDE